MNPQEHTMSVLTQIANWIPEKSCEKNLHTSIKPKCASSGPTATSCPGGTLIWTIHRARAESSTACITMRDTLLQGKVLHAASTELDFPGMYDAQRRAWPRHFSRHSMSPLQSGIQISRHQTALVCRLCQCCRDSQKRMDILVRLVLSALPVPLDASSRVLGAASWY